MSLDDVSLPAPAQRKNMLMKFNVGGRVFTLSRRLLDGQGDGSNLLATLYAHHTADGVSSSAVAAFDREDVLLDEHGNLFLDRDPDLFAMVIKCLRRDLSFVKQLDTPTLHTLMEECDYLGFEQQGQVFRTLLYPKLDPIRLATYSSYVDHLFMLFRVVMLDWLIVPRVLPGAQQARDTVLRFAETVRDLLKRYITSFAFAGYVLSIDNALGRIVNPRWHHHDDSRQMGHELAEAASNLASSLVELRAQADQPAPAQ